MFGIRKLKQRIDHLESVINTEIHRNNKLRNELYSKSVKPKFKKGDKVWILSFDSCYTREYLQGVIIEYYVWTTTHTEYRYKVKISKEMSKDVGEIMIYKTKPKKQPNKKSNEQTK